MPWYVSTSTFLILLEAFRKFSSTFSPEMTRVFSTPSFSKFFLRLEVLPSHFKLSKIKSLPCLNLSDRADFNPSFLTFLFIQAFY